MTFGRMNSLIFLSFSLFIFFYFLLVYWLSEIVFRGIDRDFEADRLLPWRYEGAEDAQQAFEGAARDGRQVGEDGRRVESSFQFFSFDFS